LELRPEHRSGEFGFAPGTQGEVLGASLLVSLGKKSLGVLGVVSWLVSKNSLSTPKEGRKKGIKTFSGVGGLVPRNGLGLATL